MIDKKEFLPEKWILDAFLCNVNIGSKDIMPENDNFFGYKLK